MKFQNRTKFVTNFKITFVCGSMLISPTPSCWPIRLNGTQCHTPRNLLWKTSGNFEA